MKRMRLLLLIVAGLLLITSAASAMESPNYRMSWYVPLTGSGGSFSSASYSLDLTAGQAFTGGTGRVQLGFWPESLLGYHVFAPSIAK